MPGYLLLVLPHEAPSTTTMGSQHHILTAIILHRSSSVVDGNLLVNSIVDVRMRSGTTTFRTRLKPLHQVSQAGGRYAGLDNAFDPRHRGAERF